MTKLKVTLFHCGFIYTGGGERIVIEEVLGLRKRGFMVECFAPTYDASLCYPDIIEEVGIKALLPQLPRWFPLRFAIQMVVSCLLAPLLFWRFRDSDIFLGANQPGAFLAWVMARILKKPYLVYLNQPNRVIYKRDDENWQTVRDYLILSKMVEWVRPLVAYFDRRSILGANKVLINGGFIAKEITSIYGLTDWRDCPGGAHPKPNRVLKNDRFSGEVKVKDVKINKPFILLTSRHECKKRFDWAIKAMKLVREEFPGVELVIPGPFTAATQGLLELTEKFSLSKNVVFLGTISQKDLSRLYSEAALSVFPAPKEDLGLVVLEAMAAGTPVVAWKAGGPTVTVVDGVTGFLAKPFEIVDLAEKMAAILKNQTKAMEMGKNAWGHIRENFSWDKHLAIIENEIEQTL